MQLQQLLALRQFSQPHPFLLQFCDNVQTLHLIMPR
jgi:hypothetical protein